MLNQFIKNLMVGNLKHKVSKNLVQNNAKTYVKAIEKFIETKFSSISTSPERNDTILFNRSF